MEKAITITGDLPVFPGFYGTLFEGDEDYELENLSEEHGFKVTRDDVEWDYDTYRKEVAESVTAKIERVINSEFGLSVSIEFKGIDSPREYNFRNDTIDVELTMSEEDYHTVMRIITDNREGMEKHLSDHFASRSGFLSFWDHDWESWMGDGGYLDRDNKDFGCCMMWALDGLLHVAAEYDSHCLYNDTESVTPQGKLIMADPDDHKYEDMFADIFVDEFISEWGGVGHNTLIMDDAQRRALLFGSDIRDELINENKKEVLAMLDFPEELPRGRLNDWLNRWERNPKTEREAILQEYKEIQSQLTAK
jgi:hypothetical protein